MKFYPREHTRVHFNCNIGKKRSKYFYFSKEISVFFAIHSQCVIAICMVKLFEQKYVISKDSCVKLNEEFIVDSFSA